MALPRIGLIVPPRTAFLPPDAERLYAGRAELAVEGLGIDEMSASDFDAAAGRIAGAAAALGRRAVRAIALLGTSLSFYRGAAFNDQLEVAMRAAAGCPALTATSAVVGALREHGARRIAVATAYDDAMNARLAAYFEAAGFEIAAIAGMNLRKVRDAMAVADEAVVELAAAACAKATDAEALFISCGAFATGHLYAPLEQRFGLPVVSTTPAALAAAFTAAGREP